MGEAHVEDFRTNEEKRKAKRDAEGEAVIVMFVGFAVMGVIGAACLGEWRPMVLLGPGAVGVVAIAMCGAIHDALTDAIYKAGAKGGDDAR